MIAPRRAPRTGIAALLAAISLLPAAASADVGHEPGARSAGWSAYLEYALTGDEAALARAEKALGETSFFALEQAMLAGRRGDRALMLERAERAVTLDPDNGEAHALLARAWFRLADEGLTSTETLERAVSHAEAAVRLETADPEIFDRLAAAHGALAMRAERTGDAAAALRHRGRERAALEAWAERFRQELAWRQLADLARELGDRAGEAQALEEIIRRGEDALLAAQRLGDVLAELGRCEAAIPVLQEALAQAGSDKYAGISLAVQLGDCASRAGEATMAEDAFRRALELDPTNLIAISGLAESAWSLGKRDEAIAIIESASDRLAEEAASRGEGGRGGGDAEQRLDWLATRARWKAAHDRPDALDDARKALALAESAGTPRQKALMGALVAEAHLGRGQLAEAVQAARQAVSQDPSHEASLITLLNASWAGGDRAAVRELVDALEKKASGASWFSRVARWEASRGFDADARRHARRAIESFQGPPGSRAEFEVEVGGALLVAGRPEDAEVLAREAAAIRPWDDDAPFLQAEALTELGRGADADAVIRAHVEARGEDPWLLERWSGFEQSRRRGTEAVAKAERALTLLSQAGAHRSARARLEMRLGEALLGARRPAEAARAFRSACSASEPAPGDRLASLARALNLAGEPAEALAVVDQALSRAPDDDALLGEKGRILLALGRFDEGASVLRGLLDAPRALAGRHGQVALAFSEASRHDEASRVAAEALAKHPRHVGLLLAAARVSEAAGRREEAESRFRAALALEPDSPIVLNALGYSLADWNVKLDEAQRLLRRAVEARPHEAAYLDSLGWAMHRLGKHDESVLHLEAALARDRDPVILAHLGHVRVAQNRPSEARSLFEEALAAGLDDGEEEARRALEDLARRGGVR